MQEQAAAVIVGAGSSQRMKGQDKLWIPLMGRLTLARTIDVFASSPLISILILVLHPQRIQDAIQLCEQEHWPKIRGLVAGGLRRQDSVRAGLELLASCAPDTRWVMIHDAARPLISTQILEAGLQAARCHRAAVAAVPVVDTIKLVQNELITSTPERSYMWAVQTPQVFSFPLIYQAHHHQCAQAEATDDAALVERLGQRVAIYPGSSMNLKITSQEDLLIAEALLKGSQH